MHSTSCIAHCIVLRRIIATWVPITSYKLYSVVYSLVPRPSHPSVCLLLYSRGERPGKTDHIKWHTWTLVDVWRSGTFLLYSCKAAFWNQEASAGLSDVECSVVYSLCLQSVVHSLTCSFSGNVPLLHMSAQRPGTSLHVISFTRPSPCISTASDKHWGKKAWVRGYVV